MLKTIAECAGAAVSMYGAKLAYTDCKRKMREADPKASEDETTLVSMLAGTVVLVCGLATTKAVSNFMFGKEG